MLYEVITGNLSKEKGKGLEVIEITIHEGKNRQVRRMFGAVGYPVLQLERIAYGPLTLDERIPAGKYRSLTREEVKRLRLLVGLN